MGKILCPICGKHFFKEVNDFNICPFCGWENDGMQNDDENLSGMANELSQKEYRIVYLKLLNKQPDYVWEKTPELMIDKQLGNK